MEKDRLAPDFIPDSEFVPDSDAPDFIPDSEFVSDEDLYGGVSGGLKAAALGVARGVSLGASDVALTKSGLMTPEEIRGYEEQNPVISPVAEYGAAAASLFVPLAPAAQIARLGKAAHTGTKAALAARPVAAKILSGTVAGAIEGGLYSGISESLSEYAMGDPTLNAEKIASHFGQGALWGGAAGGIFGLASVGVDKAKAMRESVRNSLKTEGIHSTAPGVNTKTFEDIGDALPEDKKLKFLDGLRKKKANAGEIELAAKQLDAPVFEGMISDSPHIQRLEGTLLKSPEETAVLRQMEYQEGYNIAKDAVEKPLQSKTGLTLTELSDKVKADLTSKFEAKIEPINEAYDALRAYSGQFPLSEKTRTAISRNMKKIIDKEGLIKGTPERNFVESLANGFLEVDNLDKLQKFRTAMGRATTRETKYVAGLLKDRLDNLEVNAIKRVASGFEDVAAKEAALKTIQDRALAKEAYKKFRGEMEDFGKGFFGKKRIYGPQDFLDKLDDMKPSEFGRKLFNKDNVKFANWFTKNFPEESKLLQDFKKQEIFELASKTGEFKPLRAIDEINKLQPELRKSLFDDLELAKINASKTYIDSMKAVRNFNPSDTGTHLRYADLIDGAEGFATKLLDGRLISAAGDLVGASDLKRKAQLKLIKSFGPNSTESTRGLYGINQVIERATNSIKRKVKAVFDLGKSSKGILTKPLTEKTESQQQYQDFKKKVSMLNDSPFNMIEKLNKATEPVYGSAPMIAQGIQQSLMRSTQFLASKLPGPPQSSPFEAPYEPSQTELSQFDRYQTIVEDPLHALEQVRAGTLVPETIETLSAIYPALYADMQKMLIEQAAEVQRKKEMIPYRLKQSISMFLGQPLDASMNFESVNANQAQYSPPAMPQMGSMKPSKSGMSKLTLSERTETRRPKEA